MTTAQSEKTPDQQLQEAYAELDKASLEPDVKIAVKAILTIRQAVNWGKVKEKEIYKQVDPALVKYIRASTAPDLPKLVNDVLEKLPFDLIFLRALGDFAIDLYPRVTSDEHNQRIWERAYTRLKRETIPLFLISKKLYQDTQEVTP